MNVRRARVLVLALAIGAAPAFGKMPSARLYLGGATIGPLGTGTGDTYAGGAVLGYQGFWTLGETTSSFWGAEVLVVRVGSGALPFFTGDLGLRWAPFPEGWVRPYLRANLGVSLLLILPMPSVALALGVAIPLGQSASIDLELGARYALNPLAAVAANGNVQGSIDVGTLSIGVGF